MNDDKIRISPDALIAMIVTEAQDRELARMPSLEEMNEDFQPSEKFQRKMEALVRDTKRKAEREKRLLNVKRFFITLTAAISIFSCTMLPVKAVREAVITTLIEWHDKFVSIISWILGNVTRIPRHELPQSLDFSDFLPLFT